VLYYSSLVSVLLLRVRLRKRRRLTFANLQVAGAFYPDSASKLKLDIEKFMEEALPARTRDVVAIIAPHAGYVYSGKICADAFGQVKDKQYDVIVILGTNHTTRGFEKISVHPGRDSARRSASRRSKEKSSLKSWLRIPTIVYWISQSTRVSTRLK